MDLGFWKTLYNFSNPPLPRSHPPLLLLRTGLNWIFEVKSSSPSSTIFPLRQYTLSSLKVDKQMLMVHWHYLKCLKWVHVWQKLKRNTPSKNWVSHANAGRLHPHFWLCQLLIGLLRSIDGKTFFSLDAKSPKGAQGSSNIILLLVRFCESIALK